MSCPFGRPSCFLQVSLVAERAIRFLQNPIHHNEKDGIRVYLSTLEMEDLEIDVPVKECLDELLDAPYYQCPGQASLIGTIALFPLPFRSRSCTVWLLWLGRLRNRSYVDARQLQQFFERLYLYGSLLASSSLIHALGLPDRLA